MYADQFLRELIDKKIVLKNMSIKSYFRLFEMYIEDCQKSESLRIERLIQSIDK